MVPLGLSCFSGPMLCRAPAAEADPEADPESDPESGGRWAVPGGTAPPTHSPIIYRRIYYYYVSPHQPLVSSVELPRLYGYFSYRLLGTSGMSIMTGDSKYVGSEQELNDIGAGSSITLDVRPSKDDPVPLEVGPAPDGGAQAWLAAAGAGAIFYCCLGLSNSFGAFEEFYLANQLRGEPPDKISWIGSLSAFLQFAMGMVGGPMFDRYGARVCAPASMANSSTRSPRPY